jgi:hypothetical protein
MVTTVPELDLAHTPAPLQNATPSRQRRIQMAQISNRSKERRSGSWCYLIKEKTTQTTQTAKDLLHCRSSCMVEFSRERDVEETGE